MNVMPFWNNMTSLITWSRNHDQSRLSPGMTSRLISRYGTSHIRWFRVKAKQSSHLQNHMLESQEVLKKIVFPYESSSNLNTSPLQAYKEVVRLLWLSLQLSILILENKHLSLENRQRSKHILYQTWLSANSLIHECKTREALEPKEIPTILRKLYLMVRSKVVKALSLDPKNKNLRALSRSHEKQFHRKRKTYRSRNNLR